jgi:hypothetical protein
MPTQDQMNQAVERGYARAHDRLTDVLGDRHRPTAEQARHLAAESQTVAYGVRSEQLAAIENEYAVPEQQVLDWAEYLAAHPWNDSAMRQSTLKGLDHFTYALGAYWTHYPSREEISGRAADPAQQALVDTVHRGIDAVELHQEIERLAPWALATDSDQSVTISLTPEQATMLRTALDQTARNEHDAYRSLWEQSEDDRAFGDVWGELDQQEAIATQADALAWLINDKLDTAAAPPTETYDDVRDRQRLSRPQTPGTITPAQPPTTDHQPGRPTGLIRSLMDRTSGPER